MVKEDYCSFELTKLLKEKGFDQISDWGYREDGTCVEMIDYPTTPPTYWGVTLQMAMKWLREVHKLHIEFVLNQDVQDEEAVIENHYHFNVSRLDRFANEGGDCKFHNSYEETCESAIKYCLENLI